MGWQDAPVIDEKPKPKAKWESAPTVDDDESPAPKGDVIQQGQAGMGRLADLGKDYLSAAARPIIKGVASLPLLAMDAGVAARNLGENLGKGVMPKLADFNPFAREGGSPMPNELPSTEFNRQLNTYTRPPEGLGKGAEFVSSVLAGSRLPLTPTPAQMAPAGFVRPNPADFAANASSASAANAAGRAGATASATPGVAQTETTLSGGANVRGSGGGYTFGTAGDDVSAGLNNAQREIATRGREMGMRMTPGQATGSKALQQLEAKLESQPMTSGPFNSIKANNAEVLNREAASAIGERLARGESLSADVLDRASRRIGQVFDDAADDVTRPVDPQGFLQRYTQIQDDVRGLVQGFGDHPLVQDVTKFAEAGQATGRQLQSLTSKLGKAAYKNMSTPSGDRDLGLALYQVKDYVDDLLQQGMDGARAATFQSARQQYRNLMMLTSRVGVVNPSTGNVSGRTLANVLQQKDKGGFLFGRNESGMYDAARFSQAFAPIVGDSGTATRSALPSPTDFVLSLPFNLATRAYTSSPSVNMAVGAQAGANAAANATSQTLRSGVLNPAYPESINPLLLPPAYEGLLSQRTR
jgi:hypothetical protein